MRAWGPPGQGRLAGEGRQRHPCLLACSAQQHQRQPSGSPHYRAAWHPRLPHRHQPQGKALG
eukprot:4238465-Lingulodinium_polyedra.AAC.1